MDSNRFDGIAKEFSRIRSRRHVLRALTASFGLGVLTRHAALGAPGGVIPIRCFKRGDECLLEGEISCCGNMACNPLQGSDPLIFTCQKRLIIKSERRRR